MANTLNIDTDDTGTVMVTLNRPEVHNALNGELVGELTETLKALGEASGVRVIVLAANGKSFSAGADLTWMRKMANASEEDNYQDALRLAALLKILDQLPKPTVARIHGATYGGAIGLVACCDIAIASERAIFSLSEAKLGLIPAVISPYVVRAIGTRAARRYFQSAERFDAKRAHEIGLVHEVVTPEKLNETMESVINNLMEAGPDAQAAAKQLIEDVNGARINDELTQTTARRNAHMRKTQEGQEGISAFLEKRQPIWRK